LEIKQGLKLEFLGRFSQSSNIKFHGKPSNVIHADTWGHTDGGTDMTKVRGVFFFRKPCKRA